jgi:hypothetical protein
MAIFRMVEIYTGVEYRHSYGIVPLSEGVRFFKANGIP